ncbi:MAG: hypothetical protein AAF915_06895 [Cyanobacteria bacterium P01_D01_bin.50]
MKLRSPDGNDGYFNGDDMSPLANCNRQFSDLLDTGLSGKCNFRRSIE